MVKKSLLVTVLLGLLCPLSFAFDLTAGVKGGINQSVDYYWSTSVWPNTYNDFTNELTYSLFGFYPDLSINLSYQVGIYVNIGFFDFLTLQLECYYSRLGETQNFNTDYYVDNYSKILEICGFLNLRARFKEQGIALRIYGGPDILYRLEKDGKLTYRNKHDELFSVTIDGDLINDWLFRMAGGFGIDFAISDFILTFDFRIAYPITEYYSESVPNNETWMATGQLLIGLGFILL